jgi:protein-disulfide isomerase
MSKRNQQLRAERAAAALREQERKERRRTTLTVVAVLAVIVLIVAAGFLINRARDTTEDVSAAPAGSEHGLTIGPADAPHEIVIYEDFLCPFCGQLEAATSDQLTELAADGRVRVEYRPFVLLSSAGDYSQRATAAFAVVLEESGPEVAKEFHDLLFANQPSEAGPFPDDTELVALAVEAGADETAVTEGIQSGAGDDWADAATQAAEEAGVQSTPTILLDGEVFLDGRTMQEVAENLLAAVE